MSFSIRHILLSFTVAATTVFPQLWMILLSELFVELSKILQCYFRQAVNHQTSWDQSGKDISLYKQSVEGYANSSQLWKSQGSAKATFHITYYNMYTIYNKQLKGVCQQGVLKKTLVQDLFNTEAAVLTLNQKKHSIWYIFFGAQSDIQVSTKSLDEWALMH